MNDFDRSRVSDRLTYVVAEAIRCGMDPKAFLSITRECWDAELSNMRESHFRQLNAMQEAK